MKPPIVIVFALMLAFSAAAQTKDSAIAVPQTRIFDPARDAAQDVRRAVAEATQAGKRIVLDVGGNWCKWCILLDKFFQTDTATSRYLYEHFVVVKINFSKENENKELLSAYPKVPGYPHFFVLDADGSLLHSQGTGVLEKGQGYDAGKIMAFLKKWTK